MNMKPSDRHEDTDEKIVARIRQCSEEGRLVAEQELRESAADQPESFEFLLENLLERHDDLQALTARDGTRRYYSSRCMSGAYALILLHKEEDPLQLIAAVVRQNSRDYPRPVPLDIFGVEPFGMAADEVSDCIQKLAADKAHADILVIETATSRKFLYSAQYLEPAHAALLAEWYDVGQANNP